MNLLRDIKQAYANLSPDEVRQEAMRPVSIGIVAANENAYGVMERYLAPGDLTADKRRRALSLIHRVSSMAKPTGFDFVLYEEGMTCPTGSFTFYAADPKRTLTNVVSARPELELPLARNFHPFRDVVISRIISRVSRENAMFAVVTALPNVVPNALELPWSIGEFATDTAFLTINQIRMSFLISAASDKSVGYGDQKGEIATIIAGAFGWRALARELVGKIPLGGGLIPKGAIAYAGTYVVGLSLERYHRTGYGLANPEQKVAYKSALEKGKGIVDMLIATMKKPTAV